MSRIWFGPSLRGLIAKRLQSYLLRAGFTAGPLEQFVDGDFDGNTEAALTVNGAVDVETWPQLTTDPLPALFERCLGVSATARVPASGCSRATSTALDSPGASSASRS